MAFVLAHTEIMISVDDLSTRHSFNAQIHLEWVKVTIYKKLPSSSFAEQKIVICQGITV